MRLALGVLLERELKLETADIPMVELLGLDGLSECLVSLLMTF
jgi:hypothetical protein